MPSDVLGGYLLAALFGSLALAALRTAEATSPRRHTETGQAFAVSDRPLPPRSAAARGFPNRWHGEDLLAPAIIAVAGALMLVVVVLLRASQVANFADEHHLIVLAAAGIAALAALICSALTLELRR